MDLSRLQGDLAQIEGAIHNSGWPPGQYDDEAYPDWFDREDRTIQIGGPPGDIPGLILRSGNRRLTGPVTVIGGWGEPLANDDDDPSDEEGTERLAWYRSFHFGYAWGIFIRAYGVDVVASEIQRSGVDWFAAQVMAFQFLRRHELGHFQVDLAISGAELLTQQPLFTEGRRSQKARLPGYGVHEEGLCNALARETLPRGSKRALDAWLHRAPLGYRDYGAHKRSNRIESWNNSVIDAIGRKGGSWALVPELNQALRSQVPVYLYLDEGYSLEEMGEGLLGPIEVRETGAFYKHLRNSGNEGQLREQWRKAKVALAEGRLGGGTQFRRIDKDKYRVKLSRGVRVGVVRQDGEWLAVLVDQQHDRFYEQLRRISVPVNTV